MPWRAPYRSLFIVYAVAILAGGVEFFRAHSHRRAEPDIYADPARNFPEVMSRLYPGSSEAEYMLGRHFEAGAGRNFDPTELQRDPRVLQEFVNALNRDLRKAARHYELAIGMGLKSEEALYYNYALTLMRIQADPERIDRAIFAWRHDFPFSDRRDLEQRRQAIEKQVRQLPAPEPFSENDDGLSLRQTANESRHPLPPPDAPLSNATPAGHEVETALDFVPEWRTLPGFVGSQACRQCHPDQFGTYAAAPHSRALSDVDPDNEPVDAEFDHAASGRHYRVVREEGQLIHEESLPLDDGTEFVLTRSPVRYRVGSGHFARTYLCDAGAGFLVESPITWYEPAQAWGMTPGFDKPAHRSFSRQVLENCLWCHSGQVRKSTVSDMRFQLVENAIGCERCHGPGEAHVKLRNSGESEDAAGDQTIVNPGRLPRKLAEAVCQQCHLQGDIHIGGRKLRAPDYRPGEPLEKFGTVYRLRREDPSMTVVGHVEQLGDSPCYIESATLTCLTCHNPHATVAPADRAAHFRSVCLSCHADRDCKLSPSVREEKSKNDCTQCHMPKSATEVPHLAFTHHRIGIHPLVRKPDRSDENDPLIPLSDLSGLSPAERERSLMLARLQMFLMRGAEFQTSAPGRQLLQQIDEWLQRLGPEEFDVEIEFDRLQLSLARGDLRGAERFADRTLACDDIRSEEAAAVLSQLGQLDMSRKRFGQARVRFGKLALLRCNCQDWHNLGMCEAQLGNPGEAILALDRARQLEPSVVGIYEALAALHRGRNDVAAERRLRNDIDRLKRRRFR
jgi:predicted CXXCH cytochrome family protein